MSRKHNGPFTEVLMLADLVLNSCKKSAQFLDAYSDLCILAALIKTAPAGTMIRLRPEIAKKLLEELADAAGQNREKMRIVLLKKTGELMAQLRREMGNGVPAEALLAKLTELFLRELA
jgi:predicted hydrolase (HD superfamily)